MKGNYQMTIMEKNGEERVPLPFDRVGISACKKTPGAALCSPSKQSFTKSKLFIFRNFESLVFDDFLSKTNKISVFLLRLIRVCP